MLFSTGRYLDILYTFKVIRLFNSDEQIHETNFLLGLEICKKYVLPSFEECRMMSSGGMAMSHIVLDTFNVCV